MDVADAIAAGVRRVYPGVRIDRQPIPDGGEGTIEILSTRPDAIPHHKKVQGPVEGQSVAATWLELANKTAVVEMASAAGLSLVPSDMRDPGMTSTVGVGELIADALDKGMRTIIIGCGDSGTTDGGAGALTALGVRILDENGADIGLGGNSLHNAASIDTTNLHPRIHQARLHLACNMHNVLTGDHGVAAVFGPQKGATPEQVDSLGRALTHWADLLVQTFNPDTNIHTGPGSGASGGLGAGLMALGAEAHNRFDVFLGSMLNGHAETLDDLFEEADLVITAEGAIDYQTPHGKVPRRNRPPRPGHRRARPRPRGFARGGRSPGPRHRHRGRRLHHDRAHAPGTRRPGRARTAFQRCGTHHAPATTRIRHVGALRKQTPTPLRSCLNQATRTPAT